MVNTAHPKFPMSGGCACGAVRYEVTALPLGLYACHCTDCQRKSGTAFALNMPVRPSDLRITKGEPTGWRAPGGPSGALTISWFCGTCGTRIYGERDGRPDVMTLRSGSLDDTSWLRPAAHFFMRSAQPWDRPDDGAPRFETLPRDLAEITAAWRATFADETS